MDCMYVIEVNTSDVKEKIYIFNFSIYVFKFKIKHVEIYGIKQLG